MRVLVVEDEPLLCGELTDLLRGDGHEVDVAADGASAIEKGLATACDAVVLDWIGCSRGRLVTFNKRHFRRVVTASTPKLIIPPDPPSASL